MRICHINLAKDYRGGERQTELLIRELAARGRTQRLIIREGNELASRCVDIDNLDIVQVASNPVAAALAIRGSLVAHAHEARASYSAWLAFVLFRIPYLLTRRVMNPQKPSFIRNRAYRNAGAVVAISRAVADALHENYPGLVDDVVPDAHAALAANAELTRAIRERYAGKFLIGNVAALDPAKGQMTLIEAARTVREHHPNWQFLLCGGGPDEQRLREASADLDNVDLLGFIKEPGPYYASFDVFAFPTHREAVGSAMIDAMYFGVPVVASRVGGIPEFAEDGINGRLIEPERPDQLIAALEEIIANPDWAARVRVANIERAGNLDAASMADRYEKIYERLSGQS